jgi:hypothetical protein
MRRNGENLRLRDDLMPENIIINLENLKAINLQSFDCPFCTINKKRLS